MSIKLKKNIENKKGVAILFAVLVSVFLVSVTATIISIALRQTILSSTGRDSQQALFAANTVLECAMFWDLNPDGIPEEEAVFPRPDLNNPVISNGGIECNGGNIITGDGFTGTNGFTKDWDADFVDGEYTFYIELEPKIPGGPVTGHYCASATVRKTYDPDTGLTSVTIDAKGYNTCNLESSRAIERGLQVSYTS